MEIRHHLEDQLRRLKMPGLVSALDLRLAEARENNLGHLEFSRCLSRTSWQAARITCWPDG